MSVIKELKRSCVDSAVPLCCANRQLVVSTLHRLFFSQFVDKLDAIGLVIAQRGGILEEVNEQDLDEWIASKLDTNAAVIHGMKLFKIEQIVPAGTTKYEHFCSTFVNSMIMNKLEKGLHCDKFFSGTLSRLPFASILGWIRWQVTVIDLSRGNPNDKDVEAVAAAFPRLSLLCVCGAPAVTREGLLAALAAREAQRGDREAQAHPQHAKLRLVLCGNPNVLPSHVPELLTWPRVEVVYSPFSQKLKDSIEATVRSICVSFSQAVQHELEGTRPRGGESFIDANSKLTGLVQAFLKKQQTVIDALKERVAKERAAGAANVSDSGNAGDTQSRDAARSGEADDVFSEPELRRNVSRCCVQYLSTASLEIFCEVGTRLFIKKMHEAAGEPLPDDFAALGAGQSEQLRQEEEEVGRIWDELWTTRIAAHAVSRSVRPQQAGLLSLSIVTIHQNMLAKASRAQIQKAEPKFGDSAIDAVESQLSSLFHFRSLFYEDDGGAEDQDDPAAGAAALVPPEFVAYALLFGALFEELVAGERAEPPHTAAEKAADKTFLSFTPSVKEVLPLFALKGEPTVAVLDALFAEFLGAPGDPSLEHTTVETFCSFFERKAAAAAAATSPAALAKEFEEYLNGHFALYLTLKEHGELDPDDLLDAVHACMRAVTLLRAAHLGLCALVKEKAGGVLLQPRECLLLYAIVVRAALLELVMGTPLAYGLGGMRLLITHLMLVSLYGTDPLPLLMLLRSSGGGAPEGSGQAMTYPFVRLAARYDKILGLLWESISHAGAEGRESTARPAASEDMQNPPSTTSDEKQGDHTVIAAVDDDDAVDAATTATATTTAVTSGDERDVTDDGAQVEFFCALFKHYFVLQVTGSPEGFTDWERLVFELGASLFLRKVDLSGVECSQEQLGSALAYCEKLGAPVHEANFKGIALHGFAFEAHTLPLERVILDDCKLDDDDLLGVVKSIRESGRFVSLRDCTRLTDASAVNLLDVQTLERVDLSGVFSVSNEAKSVLAKHGVAVVTDLFTEKLAGRIHAFETAQLRVLLRLFAEDFERAREAELPMLALGTDSGHPFSEAFAGVVRFAWGQFSGSVVELLDAIGYPYAATHGDEATVETVTSCVRVMLSHICASLPPLYLAVLARVEAERRESTPRREEAHQARVQELLQEVRRCTQSGEDELLSAARRELLLQNVSHALSLDVAGLFSLACDSLPKVLCGSEDPSESSGVCVHFCPPLPPPQGAVQLDDAEKTLIAEQGRRYIDTVIRVFVLASSAAAFQSVNPRSKLLWEYAKPFVSGLDFGGCLNHPLAQSILQMVAVQKTRLRWVRLSSELLSLLLKDGWTVPETVQAVEAEGFPVDTKQLGGSPPVSFVRRADSELTARAHRILLSFSSKCRALVESCETTEEPAVVFSFSPTGEENRSADGASRSAAPAPLVVTVPETCRALLERTVANYAALVAGADADKCIRYKDFPLSELNDCIMPLIKTLKLECSAVCKELGLSDNDAVPYVSSCFILRALDSIPLPFLAVLQYFNMLDPISDLFKQQLETKIARELATQATSPESEAQVPDVQQGGDRTSDSDARKKRRLFRIADYEDKRAPFSVLCGELLSRWFCGGALGLEHAYVFATIDCVHSVNLSAFPYLSLHTIASVEELVFKNPKYPPFIEMNTITRRDAVKSLCFVDCPLVTDLDLAVAAQLFPNVEHLALVSDADILPEASFDSIALFKSLKRLVLSKSIKEMLCSKTKEIPEGLSDKIVQI